MMDSPQGRREVSISGHWSEEDSFPAKGPKESLIKIVNEHTSTKVSRGPIPVGDLNIITRDEGKLTAVVQSTSQDVHKDPRNKFSIQVETTGVFHYDYKSQFVVSGSRYAVSSLLNTKILPPGTTGVLTDLDLLSSTTGQYEEGEEFCVVKKLGKGGFGEVDLCKNRGGKHYVRKKITGQFKKKEVEVLMALRHEGITGFYGYIWRDGTHEILMEYGGLSLKVFVETQKWQEMLTQTAVMQLAMQGLSALQYMHKFLILHLDIKPENVCIAYDMKMNLVIKLTDFGTSHTPQQAVSTIGWTPEYMSPEACQSVMVSKTPHLSSLFKNFDLTGKSDVFSFFLTVYFMFEGSNAVLDIWKKELKELDPRSFESFRMKFIVNLAQFPDYICEHIVQKERPLLVNKLFEQTLAGDPLNRFTAEEAKTFIQQQILTEQLTFPNIPPPKSPCSPKSGDPPASPKSDEMSVDTTSYNNIPNTMSPEMDVGQQHKVQPGGGKDIKNSLRQKLLRRQSTGPYSVDPARKLTSGQRSKSTEMSELDMSLPVFSALLDD